MEITLDEHKPVDAATFGEVEWRTETPAHFITAREDGTWFASAVNRASEAYLDDFPVCKVPSKIESLDIRVRKQALARGVEDFNPREEVRRGKDVVEVRIVPLPVQRLNLKQISPCIIGVLARVAGLHNGEFGILLRVKRPNAFKHEDIFLPASKLVSKAKLKESLGEWGINILPSRSTRDTRETDFLSWFIDSHSTRLIYNLGRIGHALGPNEEPCFALPHAVIGLEKTARVLRSDKEALLPPVQKSGSLAGWHDALDQLRTEDGQERHQLSLFFVMAALAAPLLRYLSVEAGGFHAYGESSKGKTLAARVGASAWGPVYHGKGADDLYYQKWYSTKNGLEGLATQFNDIPLILDESKEAADEDVADACYVLAHGVGKSTMTKTRELRRAKKWQTLLLSTGEQSIDETIRRSKRDEMVGQRVRMIDIQCTAKGITPTLPQKSLREFGRLVRLNHGHAGPLFVRQLLQARPEDLSARYTNIAERRRKGLIANTEKRVAERFAIVELAGVLAKEWGILPSWFTPEQTVARLHSQFCRDLSGTNLSEIDIGMALVLDYVETRLGREIIEVQKAAPTTGMPDLQEQQTPKGPRVGWLVLLEGQPPSLWLPVPGLKKILDGRPHLPFVRAMKDKNILLVSPSAKNLTKRRPQFRTAESGSDKSKSIDAVTSVGSQKVQSSAHYGYEFDLQKMSQYANGEMLETGATNAAS